MSPPVLIENGFHRLVDGFFSLWPQPVPTRERLKDCKIVSHRGEHDNRSVIENTLTAFEAVCQAGVWGIELDIRWTSDLHPVVFHDADLMRLFGEPQKIKSLTRADLEKNFPMIPTLEEVIRRCGKKMHLMVEIKKEPYPDPNRQNQILTDLFAELAPQKDYHLISLTPEMFPLLTFAPRTCFLPISEVNFLFLSRLALRKRYGGITGHYLFLSNHLISRHRRIHQKVGTGFIPSRNALFRELNRGIDWIFSNHAVKLQQILDQYCLTNS